MYDELYQLLILNKKLIVPGIGNFSVNRKSAEANFLNKLIHPPVYSIALEKESGDPSENFFLRLGELLNISESEAKSRFNDFVFDLKNKISAGNDMFWKGVGTLSANRNGSVRLLPSEISILEEPVAAEKVLRQHAEHNVLVGEKERTSVEMSALLSQTGTRKSKWWIVTLIAGVLMLAFLIWNFSKNNWNVSATSNQQTISPVQIEPSYNLLQ